MLGLDEHTSAVLKNILNDKLEESVEIIRLINKYLNNNINEEMLAQRL